ncbi:XrtA/PEP-CTERM system TPR-repeat protein PrsT [Ectothiorhodospira variabilis]|uniref:XrtA/PEP-CTERM system TPR-repeat protein PrsT n=1 Tax=Ectothiorhodospira variabilis TaxID=505694 RepID=UPI001EFAF9DB|nr:XrtA/PEP-CTERM system TPR-repeat protein PrsT [Ectothiorhodospira variabilis]MCG5497643.1 PEP-CTERM system TPR-repeat protein PrsT [Ectothiorhodospira variabilis]
MFRPLWAKVGVLPGVLLMMTILSTVALSGCGQGAYSAEEYVDRGLKHENRGDILAASIEYRNALLQDPSNAKARYLLGLTFLGLGDLRGAESELIRARNLEFDPDEIRVPLLQVWMRQERFGKVLDEISYIEELPDDQFVEVEVIRGFALLGIGNPNAAAEAFEAVLETDRDSPNAHVGLAYVSLSKGVGADAALARLAKALDVDETAWRAWSLRGDLLQGLEKWKEAIASYDRAIEHEEYVTLDRVKRALLKIRLGDYAAARDDLHAMREIRLGGHPYVSYAMGVLSFSEESYAQAADLFETTFQSAPDFVANRVYLATTRLALGQFERARQHADWLYSNFPDSDAVGTLFGASRITGSHVSEALELLEKLVDAHPNSRALLGALSVSYLLEGKVDSGVKTAQKLADLDRDNPAVQNFLALAKLMAGDSLGEPDTFTEGVRTSYQQKLLHALEALRDGRFLDARGIAEELRQESPRDPQPVNILAASYLAAGDWHTAKSFLEEVIALRPSDLTALLNLAKVEIAVGDSRGALELLEEVVAGRPHDEDVVLLLADLRGQVHGRGAMLETLQKNVSENPSSLTVMKRLLVEYLRDRRLDDVSAWAERLTSNEIARQPGLLEPIGRAQMLAGRPEAAEEAFRKWIELESKATEAYVLLADSMARVGENQAALQKIEQALAINPEHVMARSSQIKLLVRVGEADLAHQKLEVLVEQFRDHSEVLDVQGWFAFGNANYAEAERAYRALLERDPNSARAILLVRALWAHGKQDESLRLMHEWTEKNPDDIQVWLHLAGAYLSLDDQEAALSAYENVLSLNPNHLAALNNIAWLSRGTDTELAYSYAQRAHDLAPNDAYVLSTLSAIKVKRGKIEEALELSREAARRSPDVDIHFQLVEVLSKAGQYSEARDILDRVISQMPNTPEAARASELRDELLD